MRCYSCSTISPAMTLTDDPGFGPGADDVHRAVRVVSEGCCPRLTCSSIRLDIVDLGLYATLAKGFWGWCPTCHWLYRVGKHLVGYPRAVLQALKPDGKLLAIQFRPGRSDGRLVAICPTMTPMTP